MSNAIAFSNPARRASSPAPTTPPAGPETSSRAGCAAASATDATPPEESITSGSGNPASARRRASARRYARRDGREVRVDRGRRGALVLAELRRDLVRRDDVHAGIPPPQLLRHRELVRRIAEGEEQAHRHRLGVADLRQRLELERLELAVRPEPPHDAVTVAELDDRLGMRARTAGRDAPASAAADGGDARTRRSRRTPSARRAARGARSSRPSSRARTARASLAAPTARAAASTDSSCRAAVGTFAIRTRPSSTSTASVNVPPTSTPRIATRLLCTPCRSAPSSSTSTV